MKIVKSPDGASIHACAITIYYSSRVSKILRYRASPDACLYLSKNKQTEVVNENSKIIIK